MMSKHVEGINIDDLLFTPVPRRRASAKGILFSYAVQQLHAVVLTTKIIILYNNFNSCPYPPIIIIISY